MAYWACAQLETNRERLAIHTLGLAGYPTYAPHTASSKRPTSRSVPLFPSYLFVVIEAQWHTARWSPGVIRLVLSGDAPAKVPDKVIAELKSREGADGLIRLPRKPWLRHGDTVRIVGGAFTGQFGLFDGMKPRQRCAVLLQLLGSLQRVELPKEHITPA